MSEKYRNKYRIKSHRKPAWNYASDGMYFITLVTQNRICNLGEIMKRRGRASQNQSVDMQLSEFGKIVNAEWKKSFEIRNELFPDKYIIMPNHLHAIVAINNNGQMRVAGNDDSVVDDNVWVETVETHGRASLQSQSQPFYRLPKSLSSFLAGFKSAVNSKIDNYIDANHLSIPKYNRNNHFFQANYYDHIIRDEQSYQTISEYIINNPINWKDDKFYAE